MDILEKIVRRKKEIVSASKANLSEAAIKNQAMEMRESKRRSFLKRLQTPGQDGVNIIAEIKRASPSKGVIHPNLQPAKYAKAYETGGAAALSVLTDEEFFQGSTYDLVLARQHTTLPVLRKEFIISSYQLYETAVMEADAVLLIVRVLSPSQLKDYIMLCRELHLDPLVEVHSEKEVDIATQAGAVLIGINNRDLRSFNTDTNTAIRIAKKLSSEQIAVAASGIQTREDIERSLENGLFNFLIGESLVRAKNPEAFLQSLLENI
jgi:indole-3-glycerol phosphate synthase